MSRLRLSAEDGLVVAEHAVDDQDVVVRGAGLLESAVHRPSAAMSVEEAYPGLLDEAARLLRSLAVNRPFPDGDERTARLSRVTFLAMNRIPLRPDIDAAERLVIAVATGETDVVELIARGPREPVEPEGTGPRPDGAPPFRTRFRPGRR